MGEQCLADELRTLFLFEDLSEIKNASNADFDPIPPSKRTWNWGAYVAYWMADAWAVSNWEVGESPAM